MEGCERSMIQNNLTLDQGNFSPLSQALLQITYLLPLARINSPSAYQMERPKKKKKKGRIISNIHPKLQNIYFFYIYFSWVE